MYTAVYEYLKNRLQNHNIHMNIKKKKITWNKNTLEKKNEDLFNK